MSQAVQERREQLWAYLRNHPEGLTREELAEQTGVKSPTVKTDLQALSAKNRVEVRQGGSTGRGQGSYRRAWVAVEGMPTETPLYDALLISAENGATMALTADLLRKLRADLRG